MSLDGIGLKISDTFTPPSKITLPLEFDIGNPSEVLFLDYDFSLEEKVVEWSDKQKKLEEERLQRAEEEHKLLQKRQEEAEQREHELRQQQEEELRKIQQEEANKVVGNDTGTEAIPGPEDLEARSDGGGSIPTVTDQPAMPSTSRVEPGILTPMQIVSSAKTEIAEVKRSTSFNLADFEKVKDPFDDLELKTLDDRSELHQMLSAVQPQQPSASQQTVPNQFQQPPGNVPTSSNQPNDSANTVQPIINCPSQPINSGTVQSVSNVPTQPINRSPAQGLSNMMINNVLPHKTSIKDVEYPDIDYDEHICATPSAHNGYVNTTSAFASHLYAPSAPNRSIYSGGYSAQAATQNVQPNTLQGSYVPLPAYPQQSTCNVQPNSTAHQASVNIFNTNSVRYSATGVAAQQPLNTSHQPNATQKHDLASENRGMRSARSTPDISQEARLYNKLPAVSHTPPPYLQNNQSQHRKLDTPSTTQTWNPYPVVPPTMAPRNTSPAFNVGAGSHGSCVNNGGGSSNGAGSLCSLPDPYERLKPETKKFVDNITNMGFMRARVSRTVEKLGEDDKKVLDFLVLLNRLSDQGHPPDAVEDALHIFNHNEQKVVQFLKLFSQFEGLGFKSQNVREALLQTSLDQDKTLDILTAA